MANPESFLADRRMIPQGQEGYPQLAYLINAASSRANPYKAPNKPGMRINPTPHTRQKIAMMMINIFRFITPPWH
jgi:hypothetical protein